MGLVKHFTTIELRTIEKLLKEEPYISFSEICRRINRPRSSLKDLMRRNGGRTNYTAQKEIDRRHKAISNLTDSGFNFTKGKDHKLYLNDRIDALQMHIDILYEEIKNLKERK